MVKLFIVSLLICLGLLANAQTYCENCVGDNFTFLCNGKNCQGFWFKTSLPNPVVSGIQCKLRSPCYVQDHFDNATNTYYYVACNYTMTGCDSCLNKIDCSLCYPGFHPFNYDIQTDRLNCKACSDSIPGCRKCLSASSCQICDNQYRIISGLCYNKDGTLVNGNSNSTDGIFIILIVMAVLLGIGVVLMGFAVKKRYTDYRRHQPLIGN